LLFGTPGALRTAAYRQIARGRRGRSARGDAHRCSAGLFQAADGGNASFRESMTDGAGRPHPPTPRAGTSPTAAALRHRSPSPHPGDRQTGELQMSLRPASDMDYTTACRPPASVLATNYPLPGAMAHHQHAPPCRHGRCDEDRMPDRGSQPRAAPPESCAARRPASRRATIHPPPCQAQPAVTKVSRTSTVSRDEPYRGGQMLTTCTTARDFA
jgi:hypothetical protein